MSDIFAHEFFRQFDIDIFEIDMSTCQTFLITNFFDNLTSTFSKSTATYLSEMTCLNNPASNVKEWNRKETNEKKGKKES